MERRKLVALREYNADVPKRAPYYEDHAKPAWISAPVMAVAAAALLVGGHLLSRRAGRRSGGGNGGQTQRRSGTPSSNSSGGEDGTEARGNHPMNLAELRALRAKAAESRVHQDASTSSSNPASGAAPTPLGSILMLARKVDNLEEESSAYLQSVGEATALSSTQQKEQSRLLELLTQLQLKIDGVKIYNTTEGSAFPQSNFTFETSPAIPVMDKSDESVRPHRKIQTNRVQSLVSALESVGRSTSAGKD